MQYIKRHASLTMISKQVKMHNTRYCGLMLKIGDKMDVDTICRKMWVNVRRKFLYVKETGIGECRHTPLKM